jgi:hypothetical protein
VTFYDVRGSLVRRGRALKRVGTPMERWSGADWQPYPEVDAVLRHGVRLTDAQAMTLLHETRDRIETLPCLSDSEARRALRVRQQPIPKR